MRQRRHGASPPSGAVWAGGNSRKVTLSLFKMAAERSGSNRRHQGGELVSVDNGREVEDGFVSYLIAGLLLVYHVSVAGAVVS